MVGLFVSMGLGIGWSGRTAIGSRSGSVGTSRACRSNLGLTGRPRKVGRNHGRGAGSKTFRDVVRIRPWQASTDLQGCHVAGRQERDLLLERLRPQPEPPTPEDLRVEEPGPQLVQLEGE